VQVAEKVSNVVTLTARGTGGHAAIPLRDNPVGILARAVGRVADHREPVHLLPATRAFFGELARVWPHPVEATAMATLARDGDLATAAIAVLAEIPVFDAVLRNGISPTVLHGGMRHNVIPTEATATLSIRTLPGQHLEEVLTRLRAAIGEDRIEVAVVSTGTDTPPSSFTSPMFDALRGAIQELDPGIAVVPYLSTGATDSAILRSHGVQAYGILPFPLNQDDEGRMHAHDERVPVASLEFGVRLLHGAVSRMCAPR